MTYISREAVEQIIAAQCGECADACLEFDGIQPDCNQCLLYSAKKAIKSIPAADVRPVVLCRDCKWCHAGYCEKYDDLIPFRCANKPWEDWFCADGAKMEES